MMALYVASHYKNSPNDLLLMSDAPAHRLFVLLGPVDETQNALPDILAVVQVSLEGEISKASAQASLAAGQMPQGDLIPWTIGQQFQDSEFPRLSGARIMRIAVHPDLNRAGYGSRVLELLRRYYQGELSSIHEQDDIKSGNGPHQDMVHGAQLSTDLLHERLEPKTGLPPLLVNLSDRHPERLHYMGTSFGVTQELYNFWRKNGFRPLYLRQTPSDITGEHTVIMLRALDSQDIQAHDWLAPFVSDFRARFAALLSGEAFRTFPPALALSILDPKLRFLDEESSTVAKAGVPLPLSPHDLRRLQAYSSNLVDHHMVLDLVPALAHAYFEGKLPTTLSYGQAALLLTIGLQQCSISKLESVLELPGSQALALFNKTIRKLHALLRAAKEAEVGRTLPRPRLPEMKPHEVSLDRELDDAAHEVEEHMKMQLQGEDMEGYAVIGAESDFEDALGVSGQPRSGGLVSVKNKLKKEKPSEKTLKRNAEENGGSKKKKSKKRQK